MEDDKKFAKGFNAGYLIAKHNPKLLEKLKAGISNSESPIYQGFLFGTKQLETEKMRDKARASIKKKNEKNKGKDYER